MTISELIENLTRLKETHGNLKVMVKTTRNIIPPEPSLRGGPRYGDSEAPFYILLNPIP